MAVCAGSFLPNVECCWEKKKLGRNSTEPSCQAPEFRDRVEPCIGVTPSQAHLKIGRHVDVSVDVVVVMQAADDEATVSTAQSLSPTACQACGKAEKVGGCNGEGRILGGLGAVPGFGWFPIKAYRPCPAFVDAGGRYKRQGQSLEEVAFGRTGKQDNLDITERLSGGGGGGGDK